MNENEVLFQKITEHRKVHDRFLEMFGSLQETINSMQIVAADVNRHYDDLFEQLQKRDPPSPGPPSHKRRKAHSFDSPAAQVVAESSMIRNKSDPEVSTSILNQAIDLPDSEESFFVLTQSPPVATPAREPLSPRKEISNERTPSRVDQRNLCRKESDEQPDKKPQDVDKKRSKKGNLSLSRFSSAFAMSPETNKQLEQLPIRQKQTTPKPATAAELQENVAPVGKWTSKRSTPSSVRKIESGSRQTPTSATKSGSSLLNRTRLRQTKLRFPDETNKTIEGEEETYFEEFVVPSPTSFSGSRFLKSMKMKQQSSLVGPASVTNETNEDNDVFKSPVMKPRRMTKPAVDSDDENFDIDQTYFSEAEKVLNRQPKPPEKGTAIIKTEPLTQKKPPQILAAETPHLDAEDESNSDTNSVVIVKPPSQDEVITIQETQPSKSDLFMEAIREERRKEQASRQTVLDMMGPPPARRPQQSPAPHSSDKLDNPFPFRNSPLRKFPTVSGVTPQERRCTECTKHFRMLQLRGLSPETIRTKLPRNCRECRLAQLHETPPGFWNPEFSPTQRS